MLGEELSWQKLNPGRAWKCWSEEELLHSVSCFALSCRQTDHQHRCLAAQCLEKCQLFCLEGALHFVLSRPGWHTGRHLFFSSEPEEQFTGFRAESNQIQLSSRQQGQEGLHSGFLGGKLNLGAISAYSLQVQGITAVGYSSTNS